MTRLDNNYKSEYNETQGKIFISGLEALLQIALIQHKRDTKFGRNTACLFSGYRGSPLAGLDKLLWKSESLLKGNAIEFIPALNEESAISILIGTQIVNLYPQPKYDGVYGIWYGKGPGLDRAMDALKHANSLGTSEYGGVLVVAGDDHEAVSSSLCHQSEQIFMAAMLPVLNPASVTEYVNFGLLGIAMSRFSGCYVGFKAVTETVESSVSQDLNLDDFEIISPDIRNNNAELRPLTHIPPQDQEVRLHNVKLAAALEFAKVNNINHVTLDSPNARFGIVAVGKSYADLCQAFETLEIDETYAQKIGIRVYKVGMSWPLEPSGIIKFANGLERILVIEEKRAFVETQLKEILYDYCSENNKRPLVYGKKGPLGSVLLKSDGGLNSDAISNALIQLLNMKREVNNLLDIKPLLRKPYFCAGCPHGISTNVPGGSFALSGSGCHIMATYTKPRTNLLIHMGSEGLPWLGMAPFTGMPHIFQNIGDGTYVHSGSLAIRQVAATQANITYKILFNDAVAMTGGQPLEANITVPTLANQLYYEGVKRIAIVADNPSKYPSKTEWPYNTTIHHRDELDNVQNHIKSIPGVTAIIYDQACAAELRRKRKLNNHHHVLINDLVCDACGDCVKQSSCIALEPKKTFLGYKRYINRSLCNHDFSCVKGFCPSIVTVEGKLRSVDTYKSQIEEKILTLPTPRIPKVNKELNIVFTGIGGTGVITAGTILCLAAHIDKFGVYHNKYTGLAQKGGISISQIRVFEENRPILGTAIPFGKANLVIAGDIISALSEQVLKTYDKGKTKAIVNSILTPTYKSILQPEDDYTLDNTLATIIKILGKDNIIQVNLQEFTDTYFAQNSTLANTFLIGYAWQLEYIPFTLNAILKAIEINGIEIGENRYAFNVGRYLAYQLQNYNTNDAFFREKSSQDKWYDHLHKYSNYLRDYQDIAYAYKYVIKVKEVQRKERTLNFSQLNLTEVFAHNLFNLMAYKDEYEVARLYTNGDFKKTLKEQFEDKVSLRFYFALSIFPKYDENKRMIKRSFGSWIYYLLFIVAKLKFLRGSIFDIFKYSSARKLDIELLQLYQETINYVIDHLNEKNYSTALEITALPAAVRGFGHVKLQNFSEFKKTLAILLKKFECN